MVSGQNERMRMKKLVVLSALVAAMVMVSGCVAPRGLGNAFVFPTIAIDHVVSGDVIDRAGTSDRANWGNPDVKPSKVGTAEARGIVLYATGDCSLGTAMKNGGITKVHHVDYEVFTILGLYSKTKTIVYGE